MKFQVRSKQGKYVYLTEYAECIPFDKLDSIVAAGCTLHVDGQKKSATQIRQMFKDVVPVSGSEHDSSPVTEADYTIPEAYNAAKSSVGRVTITSVTSIDSFDDKFEIDLASAGFAITSRTIVCLNNGKIYRSQTEAGKDLKIDPSSISYSLSVDKPYKGYEFKKAMELL